MAYTNPRTFPLANSGPDFRTSMKFTQADYTAAGTSDPAVGDLVTPSTTANWYVKVAPDNTTGKLGVIEKLEKSGASSAVGEVVVRWLDCIRFVELTTDDLATVTLGNAAIKDGATTVLDNVDAGATTGNLIVLAKSGTSGAGTVVAGVFAL